MSGRIKKAALQIPQEESADIIGAIKVAEWDYGMMEETAKIISSSSDIPEEYRIFRINPNSMLAELWVHVEYVNLDKYISTQGKVIELDTSGRCGHYSEGLTRSGSPEAESESVFNLEEIKTELKKQFVEEVKSAIDQITRFKDAKGELFESTCDNEEKIGLSIRLQGGNLGSSVVIISCFPDLEPSYHFTVEDHTLTFSGKTHESEFYSLDKLIDHLLLLS